MWAEACSGLGEEGGTCGGDGRWGAGVSFHPLAKISSGYGIKEDTDPGD